MSFNLVYISNIILVDFLAVVLDYKSIFKNRKMILLWYLRLKL